MAPTHQPVPTPCCAPRRSLGVLVCLHRQLRLPVDRCPGRRVRTGILSMSSWSRVSWELPMPWVLIVALAVIAVVVLAAYLFDRRARHGLDVDHAARQGPGSSAAPRRVVAPARRLLMGVRRTGSSSLLMRQERGSQLGESCWRVAAAHELLDAQRTIVGAGRRGVALDVVTGVCMHLGKLARS